MQAATGASVRDSSGPQKLPIRLFAVPDNERVADAHRRSAKVAGRADHVRRQRRVIGTILGQIECHDRFPANDADQGFHAVEKLQRISGTDLLLVGVDGLNDVTSVGVKEPLRPLARCSRPAVVAPFDGFGHGASLLAKVIGTNSRLSRRHRCSNHPCVQSRSRVYSPRRNAEKIVNGRR